VPFTCMDALRRYRG